MHTIFRNARRELLGKVDIGEYRYACKLFHIEIDELRDWILDQNLVLYEQAMEMYEPQVWYRFIEGVSEDYDKITIPSWLTAEKGDKIIAEMSSYEQEAWSKVILKNKKVHSHKNLRILRCRILDFVFEKYGIEAEQLHRVAVEKRSSEDIIADHQVSLFMNKIEED